jgi:hypothetical protein
MQRAGGLSSTDRALQADAGYPGPGLDAAERVCRDRRTVYDENMTGSRPGGSA